MAAPQASSASAPRLASFSTSTGSPSRASASAAASTPTHPGRIEAARTAPVVRSIGAGKPIPTPSTRARSAPASSSTWSTNSAAAVSPWSAEWSTFSSRQVSARTVWERSETATRRWRWPKSIPTASPAEGLSETITGGRPACASPPGSPSRSPASPESSRSETIVETVERERPVTRASSARLAIPLSRRASITRFRLPSRREANEPLLLLTAPGLVSHRRVFVKPL